MKRRNISGLIIFILVLFHNQKLLSQCLVGDTCLIKIAYPLGPDEMICCSPFHAYSFSYEHISGTDFFVKTPDDFCFVNCEDSIFFTPKSEGEQRDTILLTVKWQNCAHFYCQTTTTVTYVSAIGVARNDVKSSQSTEDIHIKVGNSFLSILSNFSNIESTHLQLFDALGRPQPLPVSQLQIPAGENSQKIEIGNIPSGWYMLRMKMKDQVINRSFMVVH